MRACMYACMSYTCSINRLNRGDGLARGHAVACFGQVHIDNIPKLLLRMILCVCVCVCVCACVCMCVHTHTHIHTSRQRDTHTYIHTCMLTYVRADRQTDRQTHTHTHTHTCMHTQARLDGCADEVAGERGPRRRRQGQQRGGSSTRIITEDICRNAWRHSWRGQARRRQRQQRGGACLGSGRLRQPPRANHLISSHGKIYAVVMCDRVVGCGAGSSFALHVRISHVRIVHVSIIHVRILHWSSCIARGSLQHA